MDNREKLGNCYVEEQEEPYLFLMDENYSNMAMENNKFLVDQYKFAYK